MALVLCRPYWYSSRFAVDGGELGHSRPKLTQDQDNRAHHYQLRWNHYHAITCQRLIHSLASSSSSCHRHACCISSAAAFLCIADIDICSARGHAQGLQCRTLLWPFLVSHVGHISHMSTRDACHAGDFWPPYFLYVGLSALSALVAAGFVAFWAPEAAGSGMPEIKVCAQRSPCM